MSWQFRRGHRITFRNVVSALGKLLISLGVLVLLFVVYLLWGTGLLEASHQHALRQQFDRELQSIGHRPGSATTSTTAPEAASPCGIAPVQPSAQSQVPAEGQPIGILAIPKIGLDKVVVQGTGTDDLRLGPGHYPSTPIPGQPGNSAIAGHRTTYGAPFYDLNVLSSGDPICVTTTQGTFVFDVTQTQVVSPSDTLVVATTSAAPELTLTTCNPRFSASQRLVVHALLDEKLTPPAPAPAHVTRAGPVRGSSGLAGEQGSFGGAIAWGAVCLALAAAIWLLARRRRMRWLFYCVGAVPLLIVLFFFFENLSPLLPASF